MKFAAFSTVAASAGEATNSADMIDNLRQQTILAEHLSIPDYMTRGPARL